MKNIGSEKARNNFHLIHIFPSDNGIKNLMNGVKGMKSNHLKNE